MTFYGACLAPEILLVTEYAENSTLYDAIHQSLPQARLKPIDGLKYLIQVANGLKYLHHSKKPPIVHRDVKSLNILVCFSFSKYIPPKKSVIVFNCELVYTDYSTWK